MDLENRLTQLGYSIAGIVASGAEAIEQAAQTQPDLVLMDIRLKGKMDGIEAAREIGRRFDIPIIYLTALTDRDTLERAEATRPRGYIFKPFEDEEVRIAIEAALAGDGDEEEIQA
jgi:CheY-like chemotaxis protein